MKKDERVFLSDILESIEAVEEYSKGINKKEFFENKQIQDAVMRRLEIIGEAAKNISKEFRIKHSAIQWQKIAGLRDILIHFYHGVNLERVWVVINDDLPDLKKKIKEIWSI